MDHRFGINVAQPLVLGNDRVFISAGYGHGAAVFELARDGERFRRGRSGRTRA